MLWRFQTVKRKTTTVPLPVAGKEKPADVSPRAVATLPRRSAMNGRYARSRSCVLIVSESELLRERLSEALCIYWDTEGATPAEDAVHNLRRRSYELILADEASTQRPEFMSLLNTESRLRTVPLLVAPSDLFILDNTGGTSSKEPRPDALKKLISDIRARLEAAYAHAETLRSLRNTEASLSLALRAAKMVAWDWDVRTDQVRWSGDARSFYGVPEDIPFDTARDSFALLHPDDMERALASLDAVLQGEHDYRIQFRTIRPNTHETMWAEARAEVLRDDSGAPLRAYGVTLDVTEAVTHTEQLRALAQASIKLTTATNLRDILDIVTREAREIIGAHYASTRITISDGLVTTLTAGEMSKQASAANHYRPEQLFSESVSLLVTEQKQPLRLTQEELASHPKVRKLLPMMRGVLAVSFLGRDGVCLGVIQLSDKYHGDDFDEDDEFILVQLAQLGSAAIENIRAQEVSRMLLTLAQTARAQSEEANRAKDDFLAILSHELRSPLNAMLGWVRILKQQGNRDPLTVRAVGTLERNISVQAQIINDLLDISRIVSGKLELDRKELDIGKLAEDCVESLRPIAESRGITLQAEIEQELPRIVGDDERLQQVLVNLLSNALKFTESGGTVSLTVRRSERGVEVVLRDSGCGIEPAFLPVIFDRFRQGDSSTTRRHGGLGLGLAIVKHLTELHGGSVSVHSDGLGAGSTFTVLLPPAPEMRGREHYQQSEELPGGDSVASLDVLVVEDDEDSRDALSMFLERSGASVRTAATVRDALAAVQTRAPDVLISDIGMPDADGYSLIRSIRAQGHRSTSRTVAIAMTGFASHQDHEAALRAGFDDHIGKPVDPEVLIERIQVLLLARGEAGTQLKR